MKSKEKLKAYLFLCISISIYPLIWLLVFVLYPLNETSLIDYANSAVSEIDSHYYLSDKVIIPNKGFLLYSLPDNEHEKVIVFAAKAPFMKRFANVFVQSIDNHASFGDQNDRVKVNNHELEVEEQVSVGIRVFIIILSGFSWLNFIWVQFKAVYRMKKPEQKS